jgi:hypothetical protein
VDVALQLLKIAQIQMYSDDIKVYLLHATSHYFWIWISEKPYTVDMLYYLKMKHDKPSMLNNNGFDTKTKQT